MPIADNAAKPLGNAVLASAKPVKVLPDEFMHPPFFDKECTKCHDKSSATGLAAPMPALCYSCHKNFKDKFNYVHGPVAGGFCMECHLPHRSDNKYMLKRQGTALCLRCHNKEQILKVSSHKDIGESECTKCHDPHGGSNRFVLK